MIRFLYTVSLVKIDLCVSTNCTLRPIAMMNVWQISRNWNVDVYIFQCHVRNSLVELDTIMNRLELNESEKSVAIKY